MVLDWCAILTNTFSPPAKVILCSVPPWVKKFGKNTDLYSLASWKVPAKDAGPITTWLAAERKHAIYSSSLIARFMWSTWGPSGADRTQVAPWWPHELCYLGYIMVIHLLNNQIQKTVSCYDANFVVTGDASDDKVGIVITHGFQLPMHQYASLQYIPRIM